MIEVDVLSPDSAFYRAQHDRNEMLWAAQVAQADRDAAAERARQNPFDYTELQRRADEQKNSVAFRREWERCRRAHLDSAERPLNSLRGVPASPGAKEDFQWRDRGYLSGYLEVTTGTIPRGGVAEREHLYGDGGIVFYDPAEISASELAEKIRRRRDLKWHSMTLEDPYAVGLRIKPLKPWRRKFYWWRRRFLSWLTSLFGDDPIPEAGQLRRQA